MVYKIPLRSDISFKGRRMAGARALWRANGMTEQQFGHILEELEIR